VRDPELYNTRMNFSCACRGI